ncbi:MAG TPA: hypothetical protein VI547_14240, partial [Anaerolineales bacterium]|nr:hypothetical protein [Anaerolineales bacterium]
AYANYNDVWSDGWVGPRLQALRKAAGGERRLCLRGNANLGYFTDLLVLSIQLNGQEIIRQTVRASGDFLLEILLPQPLISGEHTISVQANVWFVPHRFMHNRDYRPLTWRMVELFFA